MCGAGHSARLLCARLRSREAPTAGRKSGGPHLSLRGPIPRRCLAWTDWSFGKERSSFIRRLDKQTSAEAPAGERLWKERDTPGQDWGEAGLPQGKRGLRPSSSLEEVPACQGGQLAAPPCAGRSHWTGYRMAWPWSSNAFILKGRRESGAGS